MSISESQYEDALTEIERLDFERDGLLSMVRSAALLLLKVQDGFCLINDVNRRFDKTVDYICNCVYGFSTLADNAYSSGEQCVICDYIRDQFSPSDWYKDGKLLLTSVDIEDALIVLEHDVINDIQYASRQDQQEIVDEYEGQLADEYRDEVNWQWRNSRI